MAGQNNEDAVRRAFGEIDSSDPFSFLPPERRRALMEDLRRIADSHRVRLVPPCNDDSRPLAVY